MVITPTTTTLSLIESLRNAKQAEAAWKEERLRIQEQILDHLGLSVDTLTETVKVGDLLTIIPSEASTWNQTLLARLAEEHEYLVGSVLKMELKPIDARAREAEEIQIARKVSRRSPSFRLAKK